MFILLVLHPTLRRAYGYVHHLRKSSSFPVAKSLNKGVSPASPAHTTARIDRRVGFDVIFGVLYLFALHGVSAVKALSILYVNFVLASRLPRRYLPAATWMFNIAILFANEFGKGYPFAVAANYFLPWLGSGETAPGGAPQETWGAKLDHYGGLIPRWEILFKFAILRMISFNLDYCWSSNRAGDNSLEVCSSPIQIPIVPM